MRKIFALALTLFITLSLLAGTAEAKRFGGGKSFGKQSQSYTQQTTPRAPAAAPAPTAPAPSGNRWLGPLAGLAAGGLLASMFMGHGFEGIKGMDILFMLALAAGLFFLFRSLRRIGNGAQPQAAAYSAYGQTAPGVNYGSPAGGSAMASMRESSRLV
jgi:Uncharacterized protein conserved in bacteria